MILRKKIKIDGGVVKTLIITKSSGPLRVGIKNPCMQEQLR